MALPTHFGLGLAASRIVSLSISVVSAPSLWCVRWQPQESAPKLLNFLLKRHLLCRAFLALSSCSSALCPFLLDHLLYLNVKSGHFRLSACRHRAAGGLALGLCVSESPAVDGARYGPGWPGRTSSPEPSGAQRFLRETFGPVSSAFVKRLLELVLRMVMCFSYSRIASSKEHGFKNSLKLLLRYCQNYLEKSLKFIA